MQERNSVKTYIEQKHRTSFTPHRYSKAAKTQDWQVSIGIPNRQKTEPDLHLTGISTRQKHRTELTPYRKTHAAKTQKWLVSIGGCSASLGRILRRVRFANQPRITPHRYSNPAKTRRWLISIGGCSVRQGRVLRRVRFAYQPRITPHRYSKTANLRDWQVSLGIPNRQKHGTGFTPHRYSNPAKTRSWLVSLGGCSVRQGRVLRRVRFRRVLQYSPEQAQPARHEIAHGAPPPVIFLLYANPCVKK